MFKNFFNKNLEQENIGAKQNSIQSETTVEHLEYTYNEPFSWYDTPHKSIEDPNENQEKALWTNIPLGVTPNQQRVVLNIKENPNILITPPGPISGRPHSLKLIHNFVDINNKWSNVVVLDPNSLYAPIVSRKTTYKTDLNSILEYLKSIEKDIENRIKNPENNEPILIIIPFFKSFGKIYGRKHEKNDLTTKILEKINKILEVSSLTDIYCVAYSTATLFPREEEKDFMNNFNIFIHEACFKIDGRDEFTFREELPMKAVVQVKDVTVPTQLFLE